MSENGINRPFYQLKFRIWDKINNKYSNIPQQIPCDKNGIYTVGGLVELESPFMENDGTYLFEGDIVGTPEGDYYTITFYDGVWFLTGDGNGQLLEFDEVETACTAIFKIGNYHEKPVLPANHTEKLDVDGEEIEIINEREVKLIEIEGVTFDVTEYSIAEIKNIVRNFRARGGMDD